MQQPGLGLQRLAGHHEGAQFGLLHLGQERHALEPQHCQHQPAAGLRHRLDHQHAGQQGMAGEMALEHRAGLGHLTLGAHGPRRRIEFGDPVHHLEVFELHAGSGCLRRHQLVDVGAEVASRTKYSSVETFPSLTSCVHCSSGILMPNALSMAKATSRKSRLSMPRSLIAWLSGVIFSRGMSQVSEMIPATVSKVDDIDQPLQQRPGH